MTQDKVADNATAEKSAATRIVSRYMYGIEYTKVTTNPKRVDRVD